MAIERAKYSIELTDPPCEIRDYAPAVVAVVAVEGTRSDAVNAGFRLLADYIFGANRRKARIAMTAPVTQAQAPDGPAPSLRRGGSGTQSWSIRFMMPGGSTLQSLPAPLDDRIHFEQSPARRVASIRFPGFWSDANLESHETQLLQWLRARRIAPLSAPTYAYYDPPWMPWFMRTIEVLFDVGPTALSASGAA